MRRGLRTMLCGAVALLLGAAFPSPVSAFDWDGHYAWTYYLALQAGFTKRQAFQIASATYGIDEDSETDPVGSAKIGDPFFGARHPGFLPAGGRPNPRSAEIWTNYHAFAEELFTPQSRNAFWLVNERRLWDLAVLQRNPGPFLHFIQDEYAHAGYDNVRGHAAAGHTPDFLSVDPSRVWSPKPEADTMTNATLAALARFRTEVLKLPPPARPPNRARIEVVFRRLVAANPPPNQVATLDPVFGFGRPLLELAVDVINVAVVEDENAGRLPKLIGDTFVLPGKWLQFDYGEDGRVAGALLAAYGLEILRLTPLTPQLRLSGTTPRTVAIEWPYTLTGVVSIPGLPNVQVLERHDIPTVRGKSTLVMRGVGAAAATATLDAPAAPSTWTGTIQVAGLAPLTRTAPVPGPPPAVKVIAAEPPPASSCASLLGRWYVAAVLPNGGGDEGEIVVEYSGNNRYQTVWQSPNPQPVFEFDGQLAGQTWTGKWLRSRQKNYTADVFMTGTFSMTLGAADGQARLTGWIQAYPIPFTYRGSENWDPGWKEKVPVTITKRCQP